MPKRPKGIPARGRHGLGCFLLGFGLLVLSRPEPCGASLVDYLQLPQLFPEHDLAVVEGGRPDWKKEWDNGRLLVRSGEYREAAESYRRLLAAKGNIEAARWEISLILARLEEWDKARTELELLVEVSPDNLDYLSVLGLALRRTGQAGRALEIFSKVRERSPENFLALVGEAQGLSEIGRKREALPLLQSVAAKYPEDRELTLSLVGMAWELGQLEIARKYLVPLAAARKTDLDILLQTARVHDGLGREKEGLLYWEKSLALDPANREARERMVRYYEDLGQPDKVLLHLQALWENDPKNAALLSRICRIYVKAALFAEGLPFFDKYLQLRPDDLDFIRSVVNLKKATEEEQVTFLRRLLAVIPDGFGLLSRLADELAAAGNFADALVMWERVARVAPERSEVYRAMDPLLVRLERGERLLEVLAAIQRLEPGDQAVIARLARLQVGQGDLRAGLKYYNLLEQSGYGNPDLYVERAALYEQLKQPSQALADYEKLLLVSPELSDIRRRATILAGELGEVPALMRLAPGLEQVGSAAERARQVLLMAAASVQARDFAGAARYYQLLLTPGGEEKAAGENVPATGFSGDLGLQARLGLADLYQRQGLVFEAEQVLRQGLSAAAGQKDLLSRLFDLALTASPADLESAAVWLEQYGLQPQADAGRFLVMQSRLRAAAGGYSEAARGLRRLLTEGAEGGEPIASADPQLFRQAGLALAEILVAAGEAPAAEQQCLSLLQQGQADREVLVLLAWIYAGVGEAKAADKIQQQLVEAEDDPLRLHELAELFKARGLPGGQLLTAEKVWSRWPDSFRAGLLKIEALRLAGEITAALAANESLGERFAGIPALKILQAQIYYQGGFYRQAGELCEQILAAQPGRLDVHWLRVRSKLAGANLAEAGRLIQEIYPVDGAQYLVKLLGDAGLPLPLPRQKRGLWQILTFRPEPAFDLVGEVLRARAFFDATPERQKINELVSAVWARLRWEKLFRAELLGADDFAHGEGKLAKKK